jgi:threonine/homoserine/homoserine lactone efflux protein
MLLKITSDQAKYNGGAFLIYIGQDTWTDDTSKKTWTLFKTQ